MTPTRAAIYVGVGSVLVALLASAAGSPRSDPASPGVGAAPVPTSGTESLAHEVQEQTTRLAERLAAAPAPRLSARNPFTFGERMPPPGTPARRTGHAVDAIAVSAEAPSIPEPRLELIGVAARSTPEGVSRTALLLADGETLLMVTEGETLGGRFEVGTVAADSVELTDLVRGGVRRLALR